MKEYLLLVEIQIRRIKTNLPHIKLTELIPAKTKEINDSQTNFVKLYVTYSFNPHRDISLLKIADTYKVLKWTKLKKQRLKKPLYSFLIEGISTHQFV